MNHKKITKKERFTRVIEYFTDSLPEPETELTHQSPYELIVAVILSAQCTDKRVNMITPDFFKVFPTPGKLAEASQEQVFALIKSCSYPNNKSKHLIGMAKKLIHEFDGEIPDSVERLQELPGVGRKTANVVAAVIYNKPVMPVDTHVFRVSSRIGLTNQAKTPLQAEMQLIENIPEELISKAHHWLILHGRYVCIARKPKCEECGLTGICKYYRGNK